MVSRSLIKTLAVFEMAGLSLVLILLWFAALGNGGSVTVTIAQFDEAYVEFVLWLLLTPVLALGLHYYLVEDADG